MGHYGQKRVSTLRYLGEQPDQMSNAVYVFVSWRRESKFTLGLSYFLIVLELTQVVTIVEFPKPNISDISVLVKTTFSIK